MWSKPCHFTAQCHWWGNCPRKHRNQQNTTWIVSAWQWNADNVTALHTACTVTLLFSWAVTEQTEGCLDWPEFPSVLWNIMGAHQPPTQTSLISSLAVCTRGTDILNYSETLHCLFHPSPRPTCSKITARKLLTIAFAISGKKPDTFAWFFFSYRLTLNSCFSEETAGAQQDLIHLECRAACNNHKIKTRQWRNHLKCLEET